LGLYDDDIAIVTSFGLLAVHPVDLDPEATAVGHDDSVLAAGRAFKSGSLMTMDASGAGIGGPLVDFDGSFVGMNFYDGSKVTPFLPKSKIVNALRGGFALLAERGSDVPMQINDKGAPARNVTVRKMKNRWPVPEPYW
ncbi:hypothetical protein BAE44_0005424, partial [Dichanthelium oligosanthes]